MNKEPIEPRLQNYLAEVDRQVPPVGMEQRIIRLSNEVQEPARRGSFSRQVLAAAAVVVFAGSLAAGVALRNHAFGNPAPASQSSSSMHAISIGTDGAGDWVVSRSLDPGRSTKPTTNVLYHTVDGGQTWQDQLHFTGIYDGMSWSVDKRQGVLWTFEITRPCGATTTCTKAVNQVLTVFTTTDGGSHWTQQPSRQFGMSSQTYFRGLTGWVVSSGEIAVGQSVPEQWALYRTDDGGATWAKVGQIPFNASLGGVGVFGHTSGVGETSLEFVTKQHGWYSAGTVVTASASGLLETTDGGGTWTAVTVVRPAGMASKAMVLGYPVQLSDANVLLPVFFGQMSSDGNSYNVERQYIYTSTDGGHTWVNPRELQASGVRPTGNEWQNFYLDANHWWFTTTNQRTSGEPVPQAGPGVARTNDGGKTWQVFSSKNSPIILQMTFTDVNNGWAFAIAGPNDTTNELLRTTDGGAHWHQVQVP
ncbi:MAG: glycoside hydrolase [Candidatus Dormibacteraeota bacterium]|nr:glycoside hydrolase [Candidatus Dormibacteraeota bacterium]